eukprot:CAMPEP_0202898046 /NCGR_PEP_ID=MMETSP1392-20130828/6663_1 /ASSEMBLY_ACC=CAM_ASM_000868 /TAXON_ID=225041 /ORGANISM="Chlamydomonas chlamydogama, Strain SAG 11-48b" /LENGTH=494 /DNA_ID=CAMNT_0049583861 /DNA_START=275 /DNA_END=1759 /DNA_ORIENTATION=-
MHTTSGACAATVPSNKPAGTRSSLLPSSETSSATHPTLTPEQQELFRSSHKVLLREEGLSLAHLSAIHEEFRDQLNDTQRSTEGATSDSEDDTDTAARDRSRWTLQGQQQQGQQEEEEGAGAHAGSSAGGAGGTTQDPSSRLGSWGSIYSAQLDLDPSTSGSGASGSGSSMWPQGGGYTDPTDPYAQPPDAEYARRHVVRDVQRLLVRAGYVKKDPDDPAALQLLRADALLSVAEECGLPTDGGKKRLAERIAQLVASRRVGAGAAAQTSSETSTAQQQQQRHEKSDDDAVRGDVSTAEPAVPAPAPAAAPEGLPGAGPTSPPMSLYEMGLGDPRRIELLQGDAGRRALEAAVTCDLVVEWLQKAHALDVIALPAGGGDGAEEWVVVATATSQHHVYMCAEAVKHQAKEAVTAHQAGQPAGQQVVQAPCPQVVGPRGGDWVAVHAGRIVAHVLTERARRYYKLEELFGQQGQEQQQGWGRRVGRGQQRQGLAGQ